MLLIENLKRSYKKILLGGTISCYILGIIIQIYYLTKFNALQFFSITQSISDGLYFLIYFIVYVVFPTMGVLFLVGYHDCRINKGDSKALIIQIICILVYIFPVFLFLINFPQLEEFQQEALRIDSKSVLVFIISLSLYNVGYYLYFCAAHGNIKLPERGKNKYENLLYKILYGTFLVFGFVNVFILMLGLSFDLSSVNISINLPLFSILLFGRSLLIGITKEKENYSKNNFFTTKDTLNIFGLFFGLFIICTLFFSILYFTSFLKFSNRQYSNYGGVYTENNQKYRVLYKNDKYVFVKLFGGNDENHTILPIDKVSYFEIENTQLSDSVDKYINVIKYTYMKIFSILK